LTFLSGRLYLSNSHKASKAATTFVASLHSGSINDERIHISQGEKEENAMASNRGVAYMGTGKVEIHSIDFPKLALGNRKCEHGVILKIVSTNICGSDQHMVRGRTTAPNGLILGHEITGEIIEAGRDVEFLKVGDLVSVPFNIACGRCRNCKERATGVCLNVNPARPGAAYGYVDMGGWVGGQAEYVMVPYADFNLLKFPDKAEAMEKIRDLTCLSDILPTGFHGAVSAGVGPGSTVYIAGAGPVGLASAAGAQLLGAACVIVGDLIPERLAQAKSFGCEVVDVSKSASVAEQIAAIVGTPEVDCAVDCVGFEARGHGQDSAREAPATVLNSLMEITRAGGALGIPGLYVTGDPGGIDENAKVGRLSIRIGLGWAKSHVFTTGQCPVMKYNRQLMQAILYGKIKIAKAVNVQVITLDQAPQGYKDFDKGAAKKFVFDPHGMVSRN
jgi:glutathione-independent formaldehyde dehydrogenase